jgi:uncharacterized DUF497 family protein
LCERSRVSDVLVWLTNACSLGTLRYWATFGLVELVVLLAVIHTYVEQNGEEIIRIISARKATRGERAHYEEGR